MSLTSIWNSVYPIVIAILFFELIIVIHEGGHYFAARITKTKVNEFSVGMGPKIFSFKRKDTEYSLRWILFGGYCSMEGESEESNSDGSFSKKTVPQRIFIIVAGAIMNLLLGFLITLCLVSSGSLIGTPEIAKFEDNAPSLSCGLQEGDRIESIDGLRVYTTTDISTGLSRSEDGNVDFVVSRDGKNVDVNVQFDMQEIEGKNYIKMDFWLTGVKKNFSSVLKETGMQFVSFTRMVFLSVHDMIAGKYGITDLSGPVGAVSVVSSAVKTSVYSMLRIMAILTINVGLFNLFPIPALDGWRFFLLIAEGITKKKIPEKIEYLINGVGLVLLLGLMSIVTFSDITKLFR